MIITYSFLLEEADPVANTVETTELTEVSEAPM
jgi:hypothetical protein